MRIVSLCPSNTEILFALGAGPEVVAVDAASDHPPEAARLPRVGSETAVDVARVAALRPDLVLASLSVPGMERAVAAIEAAGLPHLVLDPLCLEDVFRDVERTGLAVGRAEEGRRLAARLRAEVEALRRAGKRPARPPRVLIEWWPDPVYVPARESWAPEMVAIAGGIPLFGDRPGRSIALAPREAAAADPEVVLLSWCGIPLERIDPSRAAAREGWEHVTAVRTGRIHPVDEGRYGRPGPRLVEGIRELAEILEACA